MLFFFSSRRRHTRYWRDWSSDVYSSDLAVGGKGVLTQTGTLLAAFFRFEPAVTLTVLAAGMSIDSPVCGLRPLRAERWVRSTVSRPETATFSPRVIASTSSSWSPASTESTVEAGPSAPLGRWGTRSALFSGVLPCRGQ